MKRLVILSDTHIPKAAPALPRALLDSFHGADLILHAGDIVDMSVIDELAAIAPTLAVPGNMDPPQAHAVLPEKRVLEVEGKLLGLIHGWGAPDGIERRVLSKFSDVDMIVFGHTHRPVIEKIADVLLLNPGTPDDQRFSDQLSYIELKIEDGSIEPQIIWLDKSGNRRA
jgi:putative phosphoesterase